MSQSLSFILIHLVFSTKQRKPLLSSELRAELFPYLATVVRGFDCECYLVGGVADHVHLALRLASKHDLASVVRELKTSSSAWVKRKGIGMFAWQRGYAAFSVSPTKSDALLAYIDGQEEHHRKRDFQGEMRALFAQYGVSFDERYVWD